MEDTKPLKANLIFVFQTTFSAQAVKHGLKFVISSSTEHKDNRSLIIQNPSLNDDWKFKLGTTNQKLFI